MSRHQIDTVQAKDCYEPADYIMVHKDYFARLKLAAFGVKRNKVIPTPREITHAYELELELPA